MINTNLKNIKNVYFGNNNIIKVYLGDALVHQVTQHDYVEINGIKWATCNVGANNPEEPGLYFQWGDYKGYDGSEIGENEGQKPFKWEDYKFSLGRSNPKPASFSKYNNIVGSKNVLDLIDDGARVNWSGHWRMPTYYDVKSLYESTNYVWTADYNGTGVAGMIFTDKNDSTKSIFIPAAGYAYKGTLRNNNTTGTFWTNQLYTAWDTEACAFTFTSSKVDYYDIGEQSGNRFYGRPLRAVRAD